MTPFEHGKKAFEAGIHCAPALDKEFLTEHVANTKEDVVRILKEWHTGWATANVNAPVPGWEDEEDRILANMGR